MGAALQGVRTEEDQRYEVVGNRPESRALAIESRQAEIQAVLAACLDSLVRLANLSQVDLESTYLKCLDDEGRIAAS